MNKRQHKKAIRKKNWCYDKKNKPKKKTLKHNQQLIKRYPFLLPRNRFSDEVPEDYFYEYTELDALNTGWRKAFGTALCEELRTALIEINYLYEFRFMQIKQKYGSLRLYCNSAPQKAFDVLDKYEKLSYHYCETCGKPARLTCDGYWYETICQDCWDKRQNRWIKEGRKKQAKSYEKVVCDN